MLPPPPRFVTVDVTDPRSIADFAELFDLTPIPRLDKDLREAALALGPAQVVFLVQAYYTMQKNRIRTSHQTRKLDEAHKPNSAIDWLSGQNDTLEQRVRRMLDIYSAAHPVGEWARTITGIGPVICAGLLAGLDIKRAPTAGHFWRICGLNPEDKKRRGEKLIWDPALKRLCFLLGESFTKVSGRKGAFYGKIYVERKLREVGKNDAGDFAAQAQQALETRDFSKDTMARAWYSGCFPAGFCAGYYNVEPAARADLIKVSKGVWGSGVQMLPPARIQLRAQRVAVKRFLSDLHAVWYFIEHGTMPPFPWVITHGGHAHYVQPPNIDGVRGMSEAIQALPPPIVR